jgi:hypothetical protein
MPAPPTNKGAENFAKKFCWWESVKWAISVKYLLKIKIIELVCKLEKI